MHSILATALRLMVLGAGLALYLALAPRLLQDDTGLGVGLIAFALLVVVSGCGAIVDGMRHGFVPPVLWWLVVAVSIGIGWLLIGSLTSDGGLDQVSERIHSDLGLVPFIGALIAVPALVGLGIGTGIRAVRRR